MQRFTHRSESSESLIRLSRLGVLHWEVESPEHLTLSAGGLNSGSLKGLWEKDLMLVSHKSVWLFVTPWAVAHQTLLSSTISWSLLRFMSIESVMLSNILILCRPLLLLPLIFPSIRVLSSEEVLCNRQPKYWSINFSTSPSNEYLGLISFRMD